MIMYLICIHADGNHFLPMRLSAVQPLYGQLKIDWQEKKLETKRATNTHYEQWTTI